MFQSYAFQSFAFQTAGARAVTRDTHDGLPRKFSLPIYVKKGSKQRRLSNLITIYEEAKDLIPDDVELLAAIEPYVEVNEPELPDIEDVNLQALLQNEQASLKFIAAIENLEKKLKLLALQMAEDDELLMVCALLC
jgi:hypothetical protein